MWEFAVKGGLIFSSIGKGKKKPADRDTGRFELNREEIICRFPRRVQP